MDGILDFSRIEANRIELRKEPFDLNQSIGECVDVLAILSRRKQVDLYYSIDPDVPVSLIGDVGRIKQIAINLLGNALKFTNDGYVRLHCGLSAPAGDHVSLSFTVEDTGIGIEQKEIVRLFEPFHQVDNSSTRNFGGAGLGLAICQQLVELMGGNITVESEVGAGTRIVFTVQLETNLTSRSADPTQCITNFRGLGYLLWIACRTDVKTWCNIYNGKVRRLPVVMMLLPHCNTSRTRLLILRM